MPVTVKDIAKKTGYSVATVIHVLGTRAHLYRKETCEKIAEAAREMGYRPNSAARAMRAGSFGTVAFISSIRSSFAHVPLDYLRYVEIALQERDLHLSSAVLTENHVGEEELPRLLRE